MIQLTITYVISKKTKISSVSKHIPYFSSQIHKRSTHICNLEWSLLLIYLSHRKSHISNFKIYTYILTRHILELFFFLYIKKYNQLYIITSTNGSSLFWWEHHRIQILLKFFNLCSNSYILIIKFKMIIIFFVHVKNDSSFLSFIQST